MSTELILYSLIGAISIAGFSFFIARWCYIRAVTQKNNELNDTNTAIKHLQGHNHRLETDIAL